MKKIYAVCLIIILSIFSKVDVLALDPACTQEEQIRLRGLVNATQISYEFYENVAEDTHGFNVTISGFSPDFYIYNVTNGTTFRYGDSSNITKSAFAPGITYKLPFYASESGVCKGYLIMTKTVSLPNYNRYSKDPLCVGHETYELCKKFTLLKISNLDEFEKRMKQYFKDLEKKKKEEQGLEIPEIVSNVWDSIIDVIYDYYMVILIAIIIGGTTGIIVITVQKRRSIL